MGHPERPRAQRGGMPRGGPSGAFLYSIIGPVFNYGTGGPDLGEVRAPSLGFYLNLNVKLKVK